MALVVGVLGERSGHDDLGASRPRSAIYWNEEKQLAQKCTGCAHLLDDGWMETRCSQVCPTDAIKLMLSEDAEMEQRVAAEGLERYRDGLGTKPRVYYKDLHRWEKAFVACAVVFGDTDECAEGVLATVELDGAVVGEAVSDNFGEVTVDKLEPGKEYTVKVEAPGYKAATASVKLDKSTNLGTLFLEKA